MAEECTELPSASVASRTAHGANGRYSSRACPSCQARTLVRLPLARTLRPLRRVGIDFRRYTCVSCARISTIRCS
jgi:hypothetical protein